MWRGYLFIISIFIFSGNIEIYSQPNPDIIDRKDYNQSFYIKVKGSSGVAYWTSAFPKNWQDTTNTINVPPENHIKFKGSSPETNIGFSALFGLRWGKIGGGFESSRMSIDSLIAQVNGEEIKLGFNDTNGRVGFNRFYVEYQTNSLFLDMESDLLISFDMMFGTFVMSPVSEGFVSNLSLFGSFGPVIEIGMTEWVYLGLGVNYEFRYFNKKEQFFNTKWVYNNYIHGINGNLSLKFRIYNQQKKAQKAIPSRVN